MSTDSHVVVVEYATEDEARSGVDRYLNVLGISYPIQTIQIDAKSDDAIGRELALTQNFGAFLLESSGHEVRKGRKRGYATKWFYAVYGPGPARKIP